LCRSGVKTGSRRKTTTRVRDKKGGNELKKRNYFLLTLFIVLGLLLTACGGSDDKTSGGKSDEKEDEVQLIDPEKDFPKKVDKRDDAIEGGTITYAIVKDSPFEGVLDYNFYQDAYDADIIQFFAEP